MQLPSNTIRISSAQWVLFAMYPEPSEENADYSNIYDTLIFHCTHVPSIYRAWNDVLAPHVESVLFMKDLLICVSYCGAFACINNLK